MIFRNPIPLTIKTNILYKNEPIPINLRIKKIV
jgi:hypothetical protein